MPGYPCCCQQPPDWVVDEITNSCTGQCADNIAPQFVTITLGTFESITPGNCDTGCGYLSGGILEAEYVSSTNCTWAKELPATPSNGDLYAYFYRNNTNVLLTVGSENGDCGNNAETIFSKTVSTDIDCLETVTFTDADRTSGTDHGGAGQCKLSSGQSISVVAGVAV